MNRDVEMKKELSKKKNTRRHQKVRKVSERGEKTIKYKWGTKKSRKKN